MFYSLESSDRDSIQAWNHGYVKAVWISRAIKLFFSRWCSAWLWGYSSVDAISVTKVHLLYIPSSKRTTNCTFVIVHAHRRLESQSDREVQTHGQCSSLEGGPERDQLTVGRPWLRSFCFDLSNAGKAWLFLPFLPPKDTQ